MPIHIHYIRLSLYRFGMGIEKSIDMPIVEHLIILYFDTQSFQIEQV